MPARITILPAREFVERILHTPPFIVEPYVPAGSIIFMHGKAGIGKTPLTWELARRVASGQPFLGCPTRQATVLYIEVDTPEVQVKARMAALPELPDRWTMAWTSPFNVLDPYNHATKTFTAWGHQYTPQLVILNTLRKLYHGDDRESSFPSRVYGAFQAMFPDAAIWVNHHDKKTGDPNIPRNHAEDFAGSQAWLNDANVALHLEAHGAGVLHLVHTKSQVSAQKPPLVLRLLSDGHTIELYDRDAEIMRLFSATDPHLKYNERVAEVCEIIGKGRTVVTEALKRAHTGGHA